MRGVVSQHWPNSESCGGSEVRLSSGVFDDRADGDKWLRVRFETWMPPRSHAEIADLSITLHDDAIRELRDECNKVLRRRSNTPNQQQQRNQQHA